MAEMQQDNQGLYLFHEGTNYRAFEYMGAHRTDDGYVFRLWAPGAEAVFIVGLFNDWSEQDPMVRIDPAGVWEGHISSQRFGEGYGYKYKLHTKKGELYKADPYAFYAELQPNTASRFWSISGFSWKDRAWMESRRTKYTREACKKQPINIYELHAASWMRRADGTFLSYRQLAQELAPYVLQMGYTHVELMPIMEYPFDGSWGYQLTGYFAPTSRFGTPQDFMAFVDHMHRAGIGVLLDWVPAHFPKDEAGLFELDGGPLYEYQGWDRMEQADWGTRCFDVGRPEVQSFLISNAVFWASVYHIDGLRVDAVASMLYLDYGKKDGEWVPNVHGDNRNLEAIAFFQKLNSAMATYYPDVLMIAEESTAWPDVTTFQRQGLGFSLKWNMGWMNDTLSFAELDPLFRKHNHDKVTFPMMYAYAEGFVLPISHDEVVHGKKSFLDKMPGSYEEKFAQARLFLAYMMTQPGKKLTFMGSEIGQFKEWDYKGQIEWFLLDYPAHAMLQLYSARLNHLYLETPALWERDDSWQGFGWIDADNRDMSVLSYRRIDQNGGEVIVLLNFTPVDRPRFTVGVPYKGRYEEIFTSDSLCYGGGGVQNGVLQTTDGSWGTFDQYLSLHLPGYSAILLQKISKTENPAKA